SHSTSHQSQVYSSRTGRQSHHMLILTYKSLQILFKAAYVRTEWNHPVRIESFLYEAHLLAAHVSEAKINSLIHKIYVIILMIRFPHVVGNKKERKDFINLSQALCK